MRGFFVYVLEFMLILHGWSCRKGRSKVMQTVALRERPDMSDGMKIKRAKHVS